MLAPERENWGIKSGNSKRVIKRLPRINKINCAGKSRNNLKKDEVRVALRVSCADETLTLGRGWKLKVVAPGKYPVSA